MPPRLTTSTAWQQAELLMQPAFIRTIDNIRKQLDTSNWQGSYEDVQLWPEEATKMTKARVAQLQQQLEMASPEKKLEIEQALSQLPQPYPGYLLCLEYQGQQVKVDLWELCYQVCFVDYLAPEATADHLVESPEVEIDTSLIDEAGEVDWHRLDEKAQQQVARVFDNLPG